MSQQESNSQPTILTDLTNNPPFKIVNKQQIKTILSKSSCNPYMLYASEQRPILKSNNPSLSLTEITRLISSSWTQLPSPTKALYTQRALAQKSQNSSNLTLIPSPLRSKLLKKRASRVKISYTGSPEFHSDGGDLSDTGTVAPPKKPKLPLTIYKLYSNHAKSNPSCPPFKLLDPDEKAHFQSLYLKEKQRYSLEYDKYLQSLYLYSEMQRQCRKKKSYSLKEIKGYKLDIDRLKPPKRPMSAYMLFAKEEKEVIRMRMAHCTYDDVQRAVGIKWEGMNKEDKKKWEEMAMEERRRWRVQMEVFREVGGRLEIEKKVEREVEEGKEKWEIEEVVFHEHGNGIFEDRDGEEEEEESEEEEVEDELDFLVKGL